ncbi:PREDICTED: LOB domain-containing protein 33-like [Ipomoea nil]|uniref:LOB domain-containing protein 33-like n=1 Tax=Ipomoea nil TaxID=35883 RepID=UPI000901AD11|nr:PREDICTED: LOB domain-containing protein 33-like [Ipomoea nil]
MTGLGSSCGACKFLRRRCSNECVFAPYFFYDQAASHFAAVHKVFGASNVSKLLLHLPVDSRSEAAISISYEAMARMQDPIYGCVAQIFALEQQVASLMEEIENIEKQMAYCACEGPEQQCMVNDELLFFSEYNNMSINMNHNVTVPFLEDSYANSTPYSQMNMQNPPINGWEDEIFFPFSDSDISDIFNETIDPNIYLQYQLMDNGNIYH